MDITQQELHTEISEWKPIPGFEGLYWISNTGIISSKQKKVKSTLVDRWGYRRVILSKNGKLYSRKVSRLVALAFIPNPEKKEQVNHVDGNKLNDCVINLEWSTRSENQRHAYRIGLNSALGSLNRHARLNENKVALIKRFLSEGLTNKSIADMFSVHYSTISYIRSGTTWSHVKPF